MSWNENNVIESRQRMMPTLSSKQNIHTLVKEIFKYFFDLIPGTWYELWREFRVPTLGFAHTQ